MCSWKGWKEPIPDMNASLVLYCLDFPSSERSGLFSFHLASFSEQVFHISNTLQSLALIRGIEENNRIPAHYSALTAPITGQAWTKGSNAPGKEASPYGCVLWLVLCWLHSPLWEVIRSSYVSVYKHKMENLRKFDAVTFFYLGDLITKALLAL